MHILSKPMLRAFWQQWPEAEEPLLRWHRVLSVSSPRDFAALKALFGSVDWVAGYVVFDLAGNRYRLVADVVFRSQTVFVKHVFTHKEYDRWTP